MYFDFVLLVAPANVKDRGNKVKHVRIEDRALPRAVFLIRANNESYVGAGVRTTHMDGTWEVLCKLDGASLPQCLELA